MTINRLQDIKPTKWLRWSGESSASLIAITPAQKHLSSKISNMAMLLYAHSMTEELGEVRRIALRCTVLSTKNFNINLNMFTNKSCVALFRFEEKDLKRAVNLFSWPENRTKTKKNRYTVDPTIVKCVVLQRLASSTVYYMVWIRKNVWKA